MAKRGFTVLLAAALALVIGAVPRAARAETVTTVAIVSSSVVAGVLVIAIIGASLTDDDEEFLPLPFRPGTLPPPRSEQPGRMRFGTQCPRAPGGALSVCW